MTLFLLIILLFLRRLRISIISVHVSICPSVCRYAFRKRVLRHAALGRMVPRGASYGRFFFNCLKPCNLATVQPCNQLFDSRTVEIHVFQHAERHAVAASAGLGSGLVYHFLVLIFLSWQKYFLLFFSMLFK